MMGGQLCQGKDNIKAITLINYLHFALPSKARKNARFQADTL
jgi:hypothetical protein